MLDQEIIEKVDELVKLTEQQDIIKSKIENAKAIFEKDAVSRLADSKDKSIVYKGSNARVMVTNAETIKPIAMSALKEALGTTYDDFVKEDVKYSFKDPAKTLLTNMVVGNFIETSLVDEVEKIAPDVETQKTLVKKLKGKYQQDKKNLIKYVGLSDQDASDTAYLIQEAMTYDKLCMIKVASNWKGTFEELLAKVKSALIVDETIKVTLEV